MRCRLIVAVLLKQVMLAQHIAMVLNKYDNAIIPYAALFQSIYHAPDAVINESDQTEIGAPDLRILGSRTGRADLATGLLEQQCRLPFMPLAHRLRQYNVFRRIHTEIGLRNIEWRVRRPK